MGRYDRGDSREKISIPRALPFVTFAGDANDPPTITGNDTATVAGRDGMPLGTFHSATVAVDANYFVAVNVKFEVKVKRQVVIVLCEIPLILRACLGKSKFLQF